MKEISGKIGKSAVIIFIGTVVGSLMNYLTRVLIARFFGPSSYGLISMGLAFLSAGATVSLLGLRQGVARWISYFLGERSKIKGVISSAFKVGLPASILTSLLLFIFSEKLSIFLGEPSLVSIVKILSLALPFYVILDLFVSGMRGLQNSKYKVYSYDVAWPASKLILVALAVFFGFSLERIAGLHVVALVFSATVSFVLFRKLFPFKKIEKKDFPWKKLIFFSWPLMVSSILFMFIKWVDIFMLGYFKSSYEVGIYNAALPTASILIFFLFSFKYLFMPKSSELFSEGKEEEIREVYKTVVRWIFLLTLPTLILMVLFSKEILGILFGPEFSAGWLALIILAFAYFYASFVGPTGDILISIGKTKLFMAIFLVITVLDFALNVLLIPMWGITGAAVALTVSFIFGWSLSLVFLYRELEIRPFDRKLLKPLIVAPLSSVPILFFVSLLDVKTIELILLSLGYLLFYSLGIFKLDILDEEETKLIETLLRKVFKRIF